MKENAIKSSGLHNKGFSLDELFDEVDKLHKQIKSNKSAKKVSDTAAEKWASYSQYVL